MENASKALVIAGAILISILIIGLGVGIFVIAMVMPIFDVVNSI